MIKYSIILPYYNRPEFKSALLSFKHHYVGRNDYEVIIVEDIKNEMNIEYHDVLVDIIHEFESLASASLVSRWGSNPITRGDISRILSLF